MVYVPLRNFSSFTMLEGAIEPKDLAAKTKALGFPAAGLCDRNGLYAAMGFSKAAMDEGVQPVIGTLLAVMRPEGLGPAGTIDWLPLFAQDEAGYDNLCRLVSAAHLDRPVEQDAHVTFDLLAERTEGLIALSGGGEGGIARLFAEGQDDKAKALADKLAGLFPGRFYIELSRRGNASEQAAEEKLLDLAYATDLPLVATNPAQYDTPDFHAAHDAMLCIANSSQVDNPDRPTSSSEAWLKPAATMEELFADLPEALANSGVIAQRCAVAAPNRRPILPKMSDDEDEALKKAAHDGLTARLDAIEKVRGPQPDGWRDPYVERLDYELDIINRMGFPGYFLIVADFIQWAKDHDIPVGPGRGSGAGSAVAWALLITDLDPLELKLLFERFLNPERVSMPDFDIDFCETHRDKVISYVQQKYGRDKVAQIITFGRLKARAVLKDTGRVLQMSYGHVDRLAKLVPNLPADPWDLKRALNGVSELAAEVKSDSDVKRLFDLATKLEGLPRHSSTHAAGVVIGDRPLDRLVPLYRDPRSDMPVTQFDMKHVEQAGLVKFDFLGLKTLSVLKEGARLCAKKGVTVDYSTLPWDDEEVYKLLQRGDTVGVFQLESEGMRRTLAAVRPTNFGDIIALVSLYRPGPMDNIPLFGDRKNGRAEIEYPHPLLKDVLAETYGIFVYQEQVMQAAQVLAGYSLGDADLLRRAMGKKIQAEMDKQRARFVEGAAKNDISAAKANELFDIIDKFAGYGFNKSHAAAYALVAYHTAWLKVHHPAEFYAASMTYDMNLTDKLALFVDDCRRSGIDVAPPAINEAMAEFDVQDGQVRYALGALKGVGEKAMEQLTAERDANGRFASLEEFADRIDPRLLNRRQLEALASAGSFDELNPDRASVHAGAETILKHAQQAAGERESGQGGLFGGADAEPEVAAIRLPQAEWKLAERMNAERDAFGFYFSSHPVEAHAHLLAAHKVKRHSELQELKVEPGSRANVRMAGLVEEARWRTSQRGRRYLMMTLSDPSGQFTSMCFDDDASEAIEEAAKSGEPGLITAELDRREGEDEVRVTVKAFKPFSKLDTNNRLRLDVTLTDASQAGLLADALPTGDRGAVYVTVKVADGREAVLLLGRDYKLDPDLADRLQRQLGEDNVKLSAAINEGPRLAYSAAG
ncbi:DNA polymerase III subunit alpha [Sphingomicrobium aestuariivivum]|uniref:DNA polymerase III subunit alpha n=1 Tax=Sphingomicrobium aestuariivivum TaxID=1582356 RepID=UPI001FD66DD0|nr:DNA polymerase III subunit alpha [Sphingomicrobium aestuariivivum]MCJ8189792.1 DNA polymerase III subunit alpha [Sphingomicrobium aestuariivivum]